MYSPISVCIPAYNEANTITSTLDSIISQDYPEKMEILVGANGCVDNTEEIVGDKIHELHRSGIRNRNLGLISIEEKGKSNAWNVLRQVSSYNYIFFTDADVLIHYEAFKKMYEALTSNQELIAVGGMIIPYMEGVDLLSRLITPVPSHYQGCLIGRLYCFNNDRLTESLLKFGFDKMPKDVLHEDLWLTGVIGKGHWTIEDEAKVYYRPYHWTESLKMEMRNERALYQIASEYPNLKESSFDTFSRRWAKFCNEEGLENKIRLIVGFLMRSYIRHRARSIIKDNPPDNSLDGWEVSLASKQTIGRFS